MLYLSARAGLFQHPVRDELGKVGVVKMPNEYFLI